jgi:hypothetical protein
MSLQVWVDSGGKCVMQQVFKPSENFDFSNSEKFDYDSCLELLQRLVNMGNIRRICDGFDKDKIEVLKPVDVCSYPYQHACSQKCQVFIKYNLKKCIECTQLAQLLGFSICFNLTNFNYSQVHQHKDLFIH